MSEIDGMMQESDDATPRPKSVMKDSEREHIEFTEKIQELVQEYKEHDATRARLESEHPTPTGGFDYDYYYLRNDRDYQWAVYQFGEIERKVGRLFLEQVTGIKR